MARLCGIDTFRATYPVRAAPTADFTLTTDVACSGDTLRFASPAAGWVENSLEWDFGDGQFSVAASPRHVYDTAGTYPRGTPPLWMAEILFADGRSEAFTGDVALIR